MAMQGNLALDKEEIIAFQMAIPDQPHVTALWNRDRATMLAPVDPHDMSKYTRYAFIFLGAVLLLWMAAAPPLAAFAGLAYELRRVRKDRTISTSIYVICLALLLLTTGSFLFWFTVGVGFICGGG
jgi:hypothetical protein